MQGHRQLCGGGASDFELQGSTGKDKVWVDHIVRWMNRMTTSNPTTPGFEYTAGVYHSKREGLMGGAGPGCATRSGL